MVTRVADTKIKNGTVNELHFLFLVPLTYAGFDGMGVGSHWVIFM